MTDRYVYSASGSSPKNGTDWAHGYITLAAAATAAAAGDRIFVADDHSESTAGAVTITIPGTAAAPVLIACVNRATGSVPPVAADLRTTGTIAVGASNSVLTINGIGLVYGCAFLGGTGAVTAAHIAVSAVAGNKITLKNCLLQLRASGAGNCFLMGGLTTAGEVILDGCTLTFPNNAADALLVFGNLTVRGCTINWTTQPTNLFLRRAANCPYNVFIEGVDLGSYTGTINAGGLTSPGIFTLKDCKLNASATLNSATGAIDPAVKVIRSDSGNTNYKIGLVNYHGTLTTDTAYRSGGAVDGVTSFSWKIVTTANCGIATPFECPPVLIWNDAVSGTIDLTMYGVGASVPYNDELIFEAWVLGDASYPLASKVTSEMTLLDTHAALSTDSTSTWNGYTTAPFYKTLTLSPRQKGYIYIYVKAAKASATYYIDPRPIVTGGPAVSRSSLGENELFAGISRARIGIGM